jgi:hypothetical protein
VVITVRRYKRQRDRVDGRGGIQAAQQSIGAARSGAALQWITGIGLLHNLSPEQVGLFLPSQSTFGALLAVSSFAALTGVQRPSRWAALSAAAMLAKR